ncbi:hypothetical protein BH20BAC1_BH20BAC1_16510 [soil metagenome]
MERAFQNTIPGSFNGRGFVWPNISIICRVCCFSYAGLVATSIQEIIKRMKFHL